MNKKEKEIEYQKGLTELYEKTQDFGRIDFVKVLFDLKEELDIANKKLEDVRTTVLIQKSIIKQQPSENKDIDDYFIARLDTILSIIGE